MLKFIKHASDCYYKGEPIISDEEFDSLVALSGYSEVGHSVSSRIKHLYPMYSLQKCFDIARPPIPVEDTVISPKLDGAAVSLLYADGVLACALTRGDGKYGIDITDKMSTLVSTEVGFEDTLVQVTGEVVAPAHIENARNYAAGALNLKNVDEFKTRDLVFVAYDMQPTKQVSWTHTLNYLATRGFDTVNTFDSEDYPTDGLVFRIDNNAQYKLKGYTANHPKGSFALKEQKDGVVTKLLDVVWQVGKSGVVSPVAILEPIKVGDALVARATLHNIEYIDALGLEIGCNVSVIRSGDIIPRILARVY